MFAARASRPVTPEFPPWGIFVLESHHGSGFRMPDTAHEFFKIMFVLDGAGAVVSPRTAFPIHKGDVVAVPALYRHRIEDDPRHALSLIVLCVQLRVLASARDSQSFLKIFRIFRSHALKLETRRTLRQLFFEQSLQKPSCATMMTGLTLQLIASVSRGQSKEHGRGKELPANSTPPEVRVSSYVRDLEQSFSDSEKIDNVAERLGLSRRYFTRLFRNATGASWLTYIRSLRLKHAKALLRKTDRSIAIIAFECGFEDISSFYRAFRAETGMPPQQWRTRG